MKNSLFNALSDSFCATNLAMTWLPHLRTAVAKKMEFDVEQESALSEVLACVGQMMRGYIRNDQMCLAWEKLLSKNTEPEIAESALRVLRSEDFPEAFLNAAVSLRNLRGAQMKWDQLTRGLDAIDGALSSHLEHTVTKLSGAGRLAEALDGLYTLLIEQETPHERAKAFVDRCKKQAEAILNQRV